MRRRCRNVCWLPFFHCQPLESRRLFSVELFNDLNPTGGAGSSGAYTFEVNGIFYFTENDGTHGLELFKSNGTVGGTSLLKDINPSGSSTPASFCDVNGTFYFTADNGTNGIQLWKTDGTADGTTMVNIINPTGTFQGQPISLVNLNGTLYFTADDGSHGRELYKYDGATTTLFDIRPGPTGSTPQGLMVFNNKLYFSANNGTTGIELWSTDGTNTVQVCDVYNGNNNFGPSTLVAYNGNLYFNASNNTDGFELWKSDGVAGNPATEVKNIKPSGSSNPSSFAVFNGLLYFSADDGSHGLELWSTDGSEANTTMVKDINASGTGSSSPSTPFIFNNAMYFTADDGSKGPELYKSDGTGPGTGLLKEINPAFFSGTTLGFPTIFNNALYFAATNGSANGNELWRTDGTPTGTTMVRDIAIGSASSSPVYLRVFNGALYFFADDVAHGKELWKLIPPAATQTTTDVDANKVKVAFNQNVTVSTVATDYTIQQAGGGSFNPASVSYDPPSNTASFALPAGLADANYALTVARTSVSDTWGNRPGMDYVAAFFSLAGDADHSGQVNSNDFTALSSHFNQIGASYSQGDFNRDGAVNALDFNILASKFGTTIPPAAPATLKAFAAPAPTVFSTARIFANDREEDAIYDALTA